MISNNRTLFFRFCKYSFLTAAMTIIGSVAIAVIIKFLESRISFVTYFYLLYGLPLYGAYVSVESFVNYKMRKEDYFKITKLFNQYGVKPSILYEFSDQPCLHTVAKQLAADFNVSKADFHPKLI